MEVISSSPAGSTAVVAAASILTVGLHLSAAAL